MTFKTFFPQIIALISVCVLLTFWVAPFNVAPKFALASLILFANISFIAFFLAKQTVNAAYKNAFIGVYMGVSAFKLLTAPILVVWYKSNQNPSDMRYIVSFLVFFLVFMVYETYFLSLIAKE